MGGIVVTVESEGVVVVDAMVGDGRRGRTSWVGRRQGGGGGGDREEVVRGLLLLEVLAKENAGADEERT